MSVYSVWPYFIVLSTLIFLFSRPIFSFLDNGAETLNSRTSNLDGIRGILAVSVMIDHAIVTYRWLLDGKWVIPPASFYDQLGTLAVAIFFMITGFLFWGKMIRSNGRPGYIGLYINRFFRIAPVYLLAIAAMTFLVFQRTGFVLHEPLSRIVSSMLAWSALGILGGPDFNGYSGVWMILAGVTWTLKYEWYFYFSLLFTGVLAGARTKLLAPTVGLFVCLSVAQHSPTNEWYLWALFCSGMIVAAMLSCKEIDLSHKPRYSVLAIVLLATVFLCWSTPFGTVQIVFLAAFFYLICAGTDIFGLLKSQAALRLGHISYSIYLLQGIVLTLIFARDAAGAYAMSSAFAFWLVLLSAAVVLALVSSVTYMFVERPGISLGKSIGWRIQGPARARATHEPGSA